MTNELYFKWLCNLVAVKGNKKTNWFDYRELLHKLYSTEFYWIIERDSNRAFDGLDLRSVFAEEKGIDEDDLVNELEDYCSVLEMMIALAKRCEEHITGEMDDFRPDKWFWPMIINLGLSDMKGENYDEEKVTIILERFLNREYESDGDGGLFIINDPPRDVREVEIWYQLNWYLNELL